ncbi:hypothetical protein COCMIDRAFT_86277 [Bipolaris oryzae ATCC 44560]|uniref:Uncharacterized protein n=1 Tax=Bipolaris oryzae ATCC 44560 TaxID=930090 RepID=W6ZMT5_COCMI|nr:uncharacterized protein COCMIDRAFT_86277 [Bipolaris oryzae ATCC 44560]EUC48834.1 hypothetical protein COCMIDRAFT_86277 [Bipolaris oryzae ATCC 44560]
MEIKKHSLYCRFKSVTKARFGPKIDNNAVKLCKHKFHNKRCKTCHVPEAIVRLGLVDAGYHCEGCRCLKRVEYTSDKVPESHVGEEEAVVLPRNEPKDAISSSSLIVGNVDASEPYEMSIIAAYEDDTCSLRSTRSNDVLEEAIPATAVHMTPMMPTKIHIRHSLESQKRKQITIPGSLSVCDDESLKLGTSLAQENSIKPDLTSGEEDDTQALIRGAIKGDAEYQTKLLRLYGEISASDGPCALPWSSSQRSLICKARLIVGLEIQRAAGRITADALDKISTQLFCHDNEEAAMGMDEFAAYIRGLSDGGEVSGGRAKQIIMLASDGESELV